MNLFGLSGLLVFITSLSLAIFLSFKGRKRLNFVWACYSFFCSIWGLGGFLIPTTKDYVLAFKYWQIAYVGVIPLPAFFFHFICLFLGLNRGKLIRIVYLLTIFFEIINIFYGKLFFGKIEYVFGELFWTTASGLFLNIYTLTLISGIITYAHYELIRAFVKTENLLKKTQIKYFFVGAALGWGGGLFCFMLNYKLYFGDLGRYYPLGNFGVMLYPIIYTYAILRYRLMDISVAITKTGIFIATYSLVLGIPFALAFGFQQQLMSRFSDFWWIVPLISSTVLGTAGPFLYLYINKKAENRLLREQRSYQSVLRNASSGMIRIKNLKKLLSLIVRMVTKTVKITHASIYLFNAEKDMYILEASRGVPETKNKAEVINIDSPLIYEIKRKKEPIVLEEMVMRRKDDPGDQILKRLVIQLEALKAALIVPSFIDEKIIAFLILGEKRSKKLYSQDDITVFSVLANQAALAIENAQFYEEIKETQEQLFQAEKLATIGTMADGLSHQINNRFHALSLIAGDSLDIIKTFDCGGCNDDTKKVLADLKSALERIEGNVLQGGEVVKGLLKYSRPGHSGFLPVGLRDVLQGAIEMVQYKVKLKEFDLVQNIPEDLPKLSGNITQLQEVFFNMIDNAYDAIKERQAELKEQGYRGRIVIEGAKSGDKVKITVTDNGIGVKDNDQKKLFTPFFTTKATAKKGTGLGLYVIEKIITSHNGTLSMHSQYQSGTRFVIILPMAV